jgi:hypothetical protein
LAKAHGCEAVALRSIGKASASKLKIYAKNDGRYQISWYDQAGKRHVATRESLIEAKSFQSQSRS